MYKITENSTCHVWNHPEITSDQIKISLEVIKTYQDESHLIRYLKKCRTCGQLFFYEFSEEIDWVGGNDPQYRLWIPVNDQKSADELSHFTTGELQKFPRLVSDWTKDLPDPPAPRKKIPS